MNTKAFHSDRQSPSRPAGALVMEAWTLYDSPRDAPGFFVMRRFEVRVRCPEPVATEEAYRSKDIEPLRDMMRRRGLICMGRAPGDEPQVVETWL